MKQLITIIVISFIFGSCKSDLPVTIIDGSTPYVPTDSAKTHFLPDAMDFAVEYLFQVKSPDTSSVIPPDSILNKYLLPLARLYDERHVIPLLDTLIIQERIHKYLNSSRSLAIKADTSFAWVRNVLKGISPTGNTTVDSLVQLYNLRFRYDNYFPYSQQYEWFATYQDPMNNYALGRAFRSVPGVVATEPNYSMYTFSKLEVVLSSGETTILFYLGNGDCFAGCFGYDCWIFSVDKKWDIEYCGHFSE